ncbi:glycosyltransferase family A protein [Methanocorpusculum sp. MG]|uniref:Glycosyltransferase family A protein n=1 Tax=Methanocorpusculum petauri TaxID=3002863 RepID=A0ABT4IGG2_9EURY|nr:glycosyltransferase family A protein [Methanocorpusculum petauri]MCZ0860828.1 glycosyltransferase family A protein [Methanocorpusculum petauri]
MNKPFFSIVVPTKNRPELLSSVINSILEQDFQDFELIISDNSDTADSQNVVSSYSDVRIKYFKTGSLSMVDNWNFGCSNVTGKYLLIIIDKYYMKPHVLSLLYSNICVNNPCVISWRIDIEPLNSQRLLHFHGKNTTYSKNTSEIIGNIVRMDGSFEDTDLLLPRGRNCCISESLYRRIVNRTGSFSSGFSPDYSIAFKILFETRSIMIMDCSLYSLHNNLEKYSNGRMSVTGSSQLLNYMGVSNDIYTTVMYGQPIPIFTSLSAIIYEFMSVSKQYGFHGTICESNYYVALYQLISSDARLFGRHWRYRRIQLNLLKNKLIESDLDSNLKEELFKLFRRIDIHFPLVLLRKIKCHVFRKIMHYMEMHVYEYYT